MKRKTASVLMALLMLINASSISVFAASNSTSASSKAAISSGQITEKQVISIIPLDSRPCNSCCVGGGVMEIFAIVGVLAVGGALWHEFRAWREKRWHRGR